ncbi:MAG UNVERIFIED_CONTAM: hypothetical protein LVR29_19615 [Microcystis novacekii LVE1205-3]
MEKVTLIPRGQAQGLTWFTPDEEQGLTSRSQLLARIAGLLGGRVAEECVFGEDEVTTGPVMILKKLPIWPTDGNASGNVGIGINCSRGGGQFLSRWCWCWLSSRPFFAMMAKIDAQVREIVKQCHDLATKLILDNRVAIDRLVDILIEQETIEGDEFRRLLTEFQQQVDRSMVTMV